MGRLSIVRRLTTCPANVFVAPSPKPSSTRKPAKIFEEKVSLVYLKNMRLWLCALAVSAGVLFAQDSPELARTQQEIARLRELLAQGAIAPNVLQAAEQKLGDARDDQILRQTLYGKVAGQDLTEQQSREMVEAAERRVQRQQSRIEQIQKLVDAGVIARGEISGLREELSSRELTLELARARARLIDEILQMARREQAVEASLDEGHAGSGQPVIEHFEGDGRFTPVDLKVVSAAFEKKFNKPLPISANGETSVHRALGFDHRGRVDVAISPDQREGVWLRSYLEANSIPYYAFRSAVAGKATGAHIHIGPGSTRLRAAD
jgi:hypothetical protein